MDVTKNVNRLTLMFEMQVNILYRQMNRVFFLSITTISIMCVLHIITCPSVCIIVNVLT